jgi:putative hemolysin
LLTVVILALSACSPATTETESTQPAGEAIPPTVETAPGIANPASVNCEKQGGALTIEEHGDLGQIGVCYFEDNRQCEEWALLRGECPVGGVKVTGYVTEAGRYCAITGGVYNVTGDTGADPEQGTCTFPDGSQCDAWDYYNGICSPGTPAPTTEMQTFTNIEPLTMELCDGQAQAMSHFLNDLIPTVTEEPLSDPTTGASGTGCQSTITGTGADFASPSAVVGVLGGMLEEQGWTEDPMLQADGPTGTSKGYRKDNQICLAGAIWFPAESANCPQDQPISTCQVTPEQQLYSVTLNCGVASQ